MAGLRAGWRCSTDWMRWAGVAGRLRNSSAGAGVA
ncbi:hypothetical protein SALBM311S_11710 [Streptomyces alboniger]